jgi:hypothetical protein
MAAGNGAFCELTAAGHIRQKQKRRPKVGVVHGAARVSGAGSQNATSRLRKFGFAIEFTLPFDQFVLDPIGFKRGKILDKHVTV